jgi:hypothetical protein
MAKKRRMKGKLSVPRSITRLFPEVKSVEDATDYLNVHVNAKDCAAAKEKNPTECAMARAIEREYQADHVIVSTNVAYVIKGGKSKRYCVPQMARQEIVSFDRHHDFEPGEYYLRPPNPTARLGARPSRAQADPRSRHDASEKRKHFHRAARVREMLPGGYDSV